MKRASVLIVLLVVLMAAMSIVPAYGAEMLRANPNTNIQNPNPLPYENKDFSFREYVDTLSIKAPSDGSVKITLNNTKLSINHTATCYIKVRYWDGSYWQSVSVSSGSFVATNTAQTFSFTAWGIPSGASFYVGMWKNDYTGYPVTGKITVTN